MRLFKILEANFWHYYLKLIAMINAILEKRAAKDRDFYLKHVKICKKYEYPETLTEIVYPELPKAKEWQDMPNESYTDHLGRRVTYFKEIRYRQLMED